MAKIVLGLGASHTPLLTLESNAWRHRADADYANPRLNLSDGRWVSYPELLAEVGPRYESIVRPQDLERKAALCEQALDRLADAFEAAAPDLAIIIGDDEGELFSPANRPALAIFHGDELETSRKFGHQEQPEWIQTMGRGYLMDERHRLPGDRGFALELIGGLTDHGIEVASVGPVDDNSELGLGHAYGFIVKRLFRGRSVPLVPILLNTYYPPNVPTAARCHDIGRAIAQVIEASPRESRVAIIASGGLSHFVVDEQLDRRVMKALQEGDSEVLRAIPRCALNSGSSEILNWVMTAGALKGCQVAWQDYQPLYRTPAGTGVGAAFVIWDGKEPG